MTATTLVEEFGRLGDDGYRLEVPRLGTELRLEGLRRVRGELVGELSVRSKLPGILAVDGLLSVADLNVSSLRARIERGRFLTDRAQTNGQVDWTGLVERLCQATLAAEREGRPARLLASLPRPEPGEDVAVDGVRLLRRHPMILFGDGGDLKTYIALRWACRLAELGDRVLYADWEFAGEDLRDRLERLCGPDMPDIWYVRAERPLVDEAERLARIIREERIDYAVLDSIVFACDGPPESAEIAGPYFRAVRRLKVGTLSVAHTTKAEGADQKPFGSAFWHNGARSTWYVKRSDAGLDPDAVTVGLYQRKANLGPRQPAFGYRATFTADRTTFESVDLRDVDDLAAKLPVAQRIASLVRTGALTMAAIADELDVPIGTVVKTVRRHEGKRFTKVPGDDGIYRIGLLERREPAA